MNAVGNASGIRRALLGILLVLMVGPACDSGGGMDNGDDNSPPNASVTANTTDPVVGDTVALDASKSDDPDGDELSFSWTLETPDGSDATLSSPTAARPWYVPDTSGDYRAEVAVSDSKLSDTDDVSMEALEKLPETVTVPFENIADDGDSLVAQAITWRDSVVTETKRSGTATIPASRESGAFCAREGDLFAEDCISLTPTGDYTKTQTLRVDRKEVSVSVGLDLPYGSADETDVVVYEPFGADSTTFTGENTLTLPKRSTSMNRRLVADLVTEEPERSDHVDRLVADTTVSAHTSTEKTLQPSLIPACKDGISNDPADDDAVDVWSDENDNGFIDKGEGDPGCTDPDDDNEGHITWTRSIGSGGEGNDRDRFVSSEEGNREFFWYDTDFPVSIKDAMLINARVEVKVEDDQSGEEFAMELACGPDRDNENLTDIAEDNNTGDGWAFGRLRGVTADWFSEGTACARSYLHANKVRGKDPGDGNDDVFFLVDGDDTIRTFQIRWTIEEEDNHKSTNPSSLAKHSTDQCRNTQNGKMCQSSGLPKLW